MSSTMTHNVYFDGNVQSLGIETTKGKATVGVMKKGTYLFTPSTPETMIVISGVMKLKLPGKDLKDYNEQEKFDVPANVPFEVTCEDDIAYICYYS